MVGIFEPILHQRCWKPWLWEHISSPTVVSESRMFPKPEIQQNIPEIAQHPRASITSLIRSGRSDAKALPAVRIAQAQPVRVNGDHGPGTVMVPKAPEALVSQALSLLTCRKEVLGQLASLCSRMLQNSLRPWFTTWISCACNAGGLEFSLWVRKDPLERTWLPTQYSCLEHSIDRRPGRLQFMQSQELDTTERLNTFTFTHFNV